MKILLLLAYGLGLASPAQAHVASSEGGVRIEALGSTLVHLGEPDEAFIEIEWQQKPTSSDFPKIDWTQVTHEATVYANCKARPDGRLAGCEIYEELPVRPAQRDIYKRALSLLQMQLASLAQVKLSDKIQIFLYILNPGGTDGGKSFCGDPFCSVTPPPPPPPPRPTSERG